MPDAIRDPHPPEFSRPLPLNRIRPGQAETVSATPAECAALARRFRIPAVGSLECRFTLEPVGQEEIAAEGVLTARVTQICVITAEPFEDRLAEEFAVRFVPASRLPEGGFEEGFDLDSLDLEEPDELPYHGRALDLGEAAAEQLALMLDPYPRRPGAGLENAVDLPPPEGPAAEGRRRAPFAELGKLRGAGGEGPEKPEDEG